VVEMRRLDQYVQAANNGKHRARAGVIMGAPCSLCETDGGVRRVLPRDLERPSRRVLIWTQAERVVAALREQLTKVNLASLGNMVAHVHWHVIARFDWDSHFPSPVWAAAQRASPADRCAGVEALRDQTEALMVRKLQALGA
jgi:hypothetical protein